MSLQGQTFNFVDDQVFFKFMNESKGEAVTVEI